jgi:hypothetical protein
MQLKILGLFLLLFSVILAEPVQSQDSPSEVNTSEESTPDGFDCRLTLENLHSSNKCRISLTEQALVIDVKGELIKVPIGHIFAFNVKTWVYSSSAKSFGDLDIGFIADPIPQTGRRTHFLPGSFHSKIQQRV